MGIKPRTLRLYRLDISLFFSHLDLRGIGAPPSLAELDSVVADYFNHVYIKNKKVSHEQAGSWWLETFYPRVLSNGKPAGADSCYLHYLRSSRPMWGFAFLKNGFTFDLAGTILVGFVFMLRAWSVRGLLELVWLTPNHHVNSSNLWFMQTRRYPLCLRSASATLMVIRFGLGLPAIFVIAFRLCTLL